MTQQWLQLHFEIKSGNIDFVTELLTEANALAITINEPDKDPIVITSLFDIDINQENILSLLQPYVENYNSEIIFDQNWQQTSIADLKPMYFGSQICVCPSWITPPNPKMLNIILDPGMAFGTGSHQTTALCLEWLDSNVKPNTTVIDYGCGSGILAIAAAKLCASEIYATDIDPDALAVTAENAKNNNIHNLQISTPETLSQIKADTLIANILANPLIELAPQLTKLVKPKGKLALSGLLENQADTIIEAYNDWFDDWQLTSKDEWILLAAIRKN